MTNRSSLQQQQFQKIQQNMNYTLHPLISQLNMDLLRQDPFNPLQFIKIWAAKKLKQLQFIQDQEQEDLIEGDFKSFSAKKVNVNKSPSKNKAGNDEITKIKKRRNAVFFYADNVERSYTLIQKSEQAKSRIMISLKNDIFFQNLSWDQISILVQKGILFKTQTPDQVIQQIGEHVNQFFIVVSGQVIRQDNSSKLTKTYYPGECLCHESFLHPARSQFRYFCQEVDTQIFSLTGNEMRDFIYQVNDEKYLFYQRSLMNKTQLTYLDNQQKQKMISCFQEKRQIMAGQVIFRQGENSSNKRFYIVLKGSFSKCKKNLNGELMTFRTLKEGDFFGEENLLLGGIPDYSVLCLTDGSQIAFLEKDSLAKCVDSYQRIIQRAKMQVKF